AARSHPALNGDGVDAVPALHGERGQLDFPGGDHVQGVVPVAERDARRPGDLEARGRVDGEDVVPALEVRLDRFEGAETGRTGATVDRGAGVRSNRYPGEGYVYGDVVGVVIAGNCEYPEWRDERGDVTGRNFAAFQALQGQHGPTRTSRTHRRVEQTHSYLSGDGGTQ